MTTYPYDDDDDSSSPVKSFKPNPECRLCEGTGRVIEDRKKVECVCVIKQRLEDYLTPRYVSPGPVEKRFILSDYVANRLFETTPDEEFERFVRSFLTRTLMKYSFSCETGYDLITRWVDESRDEKKKLQALYDIDMLILELTGDVPNKEYASVIQSLLERRTRDKHFNWVHTRYAVASSLFREVYGNRLSNYLQSPEFRKVGIQ